MPSGGMLYALVLRSRREFWETAWLKQQERGPRLRPSPQGSRHWTGAAPNNHFRNAAPRLQVRFSRPQNAIRSWLYTTIQAIFAATSSWNAIASASAITNIFLTR